jgi:hypothetical protein
MRTSSRETGIEVEAEAELEQQFCVTVPPPPTFEGVLMCLNVTSSAFPDCVDLQETQVLSVGGWQRS